MPNPRAQKPLTLELVKKDLISFKEPAMALADMFASALRGSVAATSGVGGDIRELIDLFGAEAVEKVLGKRVMPTTEEMNKILPPAVPENASPSRKKTAETYGALGEFMPLPMTGRAAKLASYFIGRGTGALTRAGAEAVNNANLYGEGPLAAVTPQVMNIVKSGGGNWLRQGLDEQRSLGDAGRGRAMQGWNRQPPEHQARYPERQLGAVADDTVADWANNNMLKYMANQMGTKNDPVRKLAEQNISHFGMKPDEFGEFPFVKPSDQTKKLRKQHTERTGEESSMANSSLAQHWENSSDNAIKATTVGDIKNAPNFYGSLKAKEDIASYVDKVPPETPIYNIDTGDNYMTARGSLGFNRMMGVMRDDIAAGRVTPEEVAKWDMEQAVRHVDKRDKAIWKAEEEETDRLAKEFAKYFPTLKEYPDKSRWIELKVPEIKELPEGYKSVPYKSNYSEGVRILDPKGEQVSAGDNMDEALKNWGTVKLEEALAHEGEKMGHCVGSYCEDVAEGRTRIFSYRDANGDPHVTMEVIPNENPYPISGEPYSRLSTEQKTQYREHVRQWRLRNPDVEELTDENVVQALKEAGVPPQPDNIMQIKGKQDARPVDRYIPYVQDFQRTTNYPIEGDFANSGFVKQDGKYMTQAEYDDYLLNELKPPPEVPPTEGMKAGGAVHISDNPDTMAMELQNQRYQAGGVVRGLKALKGALRNPEALVPSARGATKFAEPAPKTMSIMKEKGGNWLGGNIAGGVDKRLKSLKTDTVAGKTPAERIPMHEELLLNPELNDEGRVTVQRHLDVTRGEAALDKWIESNVGNYVKKEMGTPEDPVRLMLEKRAQEIEAQFQVDMNRARRTLAKAEVETDPDKRANLMRRADQQGIDAKADKDFANEYATHLPPDEYRPDEDALIDLKDKRIAQGFDPEGMAKSAPAKQWENISDEAINVTRAGDIQKQQAMQEQSKQANLAYDKIFNEVEERYPVEFRKLMDERGVELDDQQYMNIIKSTPFDEKASFLGIKDEFLKLRQESFNADRMFSSGLQEIGEENPFVAKLDPETKLYQAYIGDLGIDHVVDVIKQDVAAGRIRPDQLSKLTMDQAVKRTAEYNKELIQKMNSERAAAREGLPLYKEYPEGYRWVELNKPGAFNAESEAMGHSVKGYEPPKGHPDWTENSGDYGSLSYGHGGWEGIKSGRAKVYSLVDSKGSPHVTVEVGKLQVRTEPEEMQKIYDQAVQEANERNLNTHAEFNGFYYDRVKQLQNDLIDRKQANASDVITQIKGKGNQKPVEDYIPFVQDFVRGGKWSDVKDMHHTDLHKLGSEYLTSSEAEAKYKPKIQEALNFLETHPSLEQQRIAQKAAEEFRGDVFDPEYDRLKNAAGRPITGGVPYTIRELRALLQSPEDWVNRGETIYTPISTALDRINDAKQELRIFDLPPEGEGMKAGGKVNFSNNPDSMQMELDNKKFAMGGAVEGNNDVGSPSPQNSASPVAGYQAGGVVKGLTALKQALTGGSAEAAKAARVAALRQSGLSVAEAKARVELAEQAAEMKQALKASEALARIEGKHLNITQADRTKVGEGYLGGPGFSGLQMKEGPHKDVGAVWGVKNAGTAKTMLGGFDKPLGNEYFTTMIGSPTQHQSNQMVFDKLYKDFTAQAKKGNLDSNLRKQINDRLASAVDKDGNAIFPPNIDILSKNFKKQASTFDQRAVAGNVLGGVGIGGKKGQIIDYEKIIRDTTDPFLLDTPSGDLGYRLWTPSGEIIERPDLHPAFPTIATGEDLGVEFAPADKNVLLAPFLEKFRAERGRDPGYMDMTRGRPARVQITEPLLKNLQESGNKAGGAVKAKNKYSDGGAISALMKHAETAGQSARMNNQRM